MQANAPRLRQHLAEVDDAAFRRSQHHAQRRVQAVGNFHAVASRQQHVAIGRVDEAAVLHIGRNQVNKATLGGVDRALVVHLALTACATEIEFAGQKVGVAELERGGNQPGRVDACPLAKHDAVGVDQENPAIGLQLAQDLARALTGDTVQHGAGAGLLDKFGELVLPD